MESIGDRIAEHAAHLDAAMHRLLTDLRAFDLGGGWHLQGARSCAQWLAWRVGWDAGTAREHVRVANRLATLPLIDEELRTGQISYAKVRAMTRVATPANEATLVEEARHTTGAQLEQICRKYKTVQRHDAGVKPADDEQRRHVSRYDTADGMVRIEALLHPEEAALVWAALDRIAAEQCREPSSSQPDPGSEREAEAEGEHEHEPEPEVQCESELQCESEHESEHEHEHEQQGESDPGCVSIVESATAADTCDDEAASDPQISKSAASLNKNVSAETSARAPSPAATFLAETSTRAPSRAGAGFAETSARAPSPAGDRKRRFDRATALVTMAGDVVRGTRKNRSPIELVISIAADTLHRCAAKTRDPSLRPLTGEATSGQPAAPATLDPNRMGPTGSGGASRASASTDVSGPVETDASYGVAIADECLESSGDDASFDLSGNGPFDPSGGDASFDPRRDASFGPRGDASFDPRGDDQLDPCDVACISDGTCISAQAARRLACDCGVVYVIESVAGGTPLSVGRRVRTIAGAMKRALLRRDKTCRFPGCNTRVFLEGHHREYWADGGKTELENMTALCSLCRARHKLHYAGCVVMPGRAAASTVMRSLYPA